MLIAGEPCTTESSLLQHDQRNRRHISYFVPGLMKNKFGHCEHCPIADGNICDYPEVRDMFDPNVNEGDGDGWLRPKIRFHLMLRPDGTAMPGFNDPYSATGPFGRHVGYLNTALKQGKIEFQADFKACGSSNSQERRKCPVTVYNQADKAGSLFLSLPTPLQNARLMFGNGDEKTKRIACGPWTVADGRKQDIIRDVSCCSWTDAPVSDSYYKHYNMGNVRAGDTLEFGARGFMCRTAKYNGFTQDAGSCTHVDARLCAVRGYDPLTEGYDSTVVGCQEQYMDLTGNVKHEQIARYNGDYIVQFKMIPLNEIVDIEYWVSVTKKNCFKDLGSYMDAFIDGYSDISTRQDEFHSIAFDDKSTIFRWTPGTGNKPARFQAEMSPTGGQANLPQSGGNGVGWSIVRASYMASDVDDCNDVDKRAKHYGDLGDSAAESEVFSKCGKLSAFTHEIGHNLGLWHTKHGTRGEHPSLTDFKDPNDWSTSFIAHDSCSCQDW